MGTMAGILGLREIRPEAIFLIFFVVYSIVFHEVAHAWVAYLCGDPTARDAGRITLNPIPHIDPIGTILLPVLFALRILPIAFGWARPVPVDPTRLRWHPWGDILVSIAGVTANLLIATFVALVLTLTGNAGPDGASTLGGFVLWSVHYWNIWLAVFNLIPIPPLDGSHVAKYLLPRGARRVYEGIGFMGILLVLLFINMPGVRDVLFGAHAAISNFIFSLMPIAGGA